MISMIDIDSRANVNAKRARKTEFARAAPSQPDRRATSRVVVIAPPSR
jgi:hypothetical protein